MVLIQKFIRYHKKYKNIIKSNKAKCQAHNLSIKDFYNQINLKLELAHESSSFYEYRM